MGGHAVNTHRHSRAQQPAASSRLPPLTVQAVIAPRVALSSCVCICVGLHPREWRAQACSPVSTSYFTTPSSSVDGPTACAFSCGIFGASITWRAPTQWREMQSVSCRG